LLPKGNDAIRIKVVLIGFMTTDINRWLPKDSVSVDLL
jgi:hypothetical protein